jgi:two-component system CheB/CheR fusion protein
MTSPGTEAEFERLIDYLNSSRGLDFAGYKRASLIRRFDKRMQSVAVATYSEYREYLKAYPEEFLHLFNALLINVTSFFRDGAVWDSLASEVIPRILAYKDLHEPIRVWSAGCSSGEEPYSLAMILAEALGMEQFRSRVKIYATDIDDEALNEARQADYLPRQIGGITAERLATYFEPTETGYRFRKDLRRCVIFGRHDLIQDPPISKLDLLVCRNTLMYFNAETQARILSRFHFALRDSGFLFLGKAEMLLTHTHLFVPTDLKQRIFLKVPKVNRLGQLLELSESRPNLVGSTWSRLRDLAFEDSQNARIVVDTTSLLVSINEQARYLFSLTLRDIGRPLQDLELSYRPVELRSCLDQAYAQRQLVQISEIEWQLPQGDSLYLDLQVIPLADSDHSLLGASITFTDMTRYKHLQDLLEHSKQELEMAYEELQTTNEELETTNEELQSANEELETTNEELQSTNEELETMNEELQSTNEELQTVNEELQHRSEELNQSNLFLESILTSLNGGVVVVNRDLQVQIWNHKSEDLWGLRNFEAVGQNFLNLDIGLPVDQLRLAIRSCLTSNSNEISGEISPVVLPAVNRRGRSIQCRITCMPLNKSQQETLGVILLMEELDHSDHAPDSSH